MRKKVVRPKVRYTDKGGKYTNYIYPNVVDIPIRVVGSSGYINATGIVELLSIQRRAIYYHIRTLKRYPASDRRVMRMKGRSITRKVRRG